MIFKSQIYFRVSLLKGVLYVPGVLAYLACSRALRTCHAYALGLLHKMACLSCFKKWRVCSASLNGMLGVLHQIACLMLLNCFLGVCDHGALVKCRFWMRSKVFNGRQEIAKPIITIFVFVLLNLKFLVWI